ncbi:MAG: preprotein translocase subunit YajC [bacterium]|nr:preprotein translocase subunit YajC [bacterium]
MGILLDGTTGAVENGSAAAGSLVSMLVVYALFFVAIWFFLFRPQSKEKKRTAAMLASLTIGDCVLTTSGFYGIVIDISEEDNTVIVEFGNNRNCRIPMEKSAISRVEKAEGN